MQRLTIVLFLQQKIKRLLFWKGDKMNWQNNKLIFIWLISLKVKPAQHIIFD